MLYRLRKYSIIIILYLTLAVVSRLTNNSPPHKPLQPPTLFTSVAIGRAVCPVKTKEGADGAVE
jgi:hypothetical protein